MNEIPYAKHAQEIAERLFEKGGARPRPPYAGRPGKNEVRYETDGKLSIVVRGPKAGLWNDRNAASM
jgi:hypothetical protein